jgi:hypothetical protein
MTRPVGSAISFGDRVGTIWHDNPYLSLSHPHLKSDPPADGFSHNISNSAWSALSTEGEIASLNLVCVR